MYVISQGAVPLPAWAQYHETMKLLSMMSDEQTLVLYSGHPMGLFPSNKDAPRLVVTNGMVSRSAVQCSAVSSEQ